MGSMNIGPIAQMLYKRPRTTLKAAAALKLSESLDSQLTSFDARFNGRAAHEIPEVVCPRPVFILSAGWRSGSTLLQRMVMSENPEIIIWGEPYAEAAPILALADQMRPFSETWPDDRFFLEGHGNDLAKEWIANLYPPAAHFRAAHLAYLETLLARPARELGRAQWGLKEVRFGADEVRYLQWLYPRARFIFLVREPAAAYRSYKVKRNWFARWPHEMVTNPFDFGRLWGRLTHDFRKLSAQGVGPLLRYEDLGSETSRQALQDYLGWPVPPLEHMAQVTGLGDAGRSRSESPGQGIPARLRWIDRALLRRGTGATASELGYG
jgi:hypothetical protein